MAITINRTPGPPLRSPAICLNFGADLLTGTASAIVNGTAVTAESFTLNQLTQQTCIKGTLTKLTWDTELGDNTSQFIIRVDGAATFTFLITGAKGTLPLDIDVPEGAEISIEKTGTGTMPRDGTYQITGVAA